MSRAYGFYETHHVERAVTLILKAVGFTPYRRLSNWIARATCWVMNLRAGRNEPITD